MDVYDPEEWAVNPQYRWVNGELLTLYPIGALALALRRRPPTIRLWEHQGLIPPPRFRLRAKDWRGRRRLYTHDEIRLLRRVAAQEGLLRPGVGPTSTNFPDRAREAFRELHAIAG